jgi:hypothetical protein
VSCCWCHSCIRVSCAITTRSTSCCDQPAPMFGSAACLRNNIINQQLPSVGVSVGQLQPWWQPLLEPLHNIYTARPAKTRFKPRSRVKPYPGHGFGSGGRHCRPRGSARLESRAHW